MSIKRLIKKLSVLPHGLRYKLMIAFSLMSLIPLLVLAYFVNNFVLLGESPSAKQVSVLALLCVIISWLGFFLAKNIIERVIDISIETKIITEGNYERKIYIDTGDEIGEIGESINFLTRKIKDNITELKDYQDKVKEINTEIQTRVSILSSLLQVGELISASVELDRILEFVLGRLARIYENGFAVLYLAHAGEKLLALRSSYKTDGRDISEMPVEEGRGVLGKAVLRRKHAIVDASSRLSSGEHLDFKARYKCENLVAFPMFAGKHSRGLLVVGNDLKNFTYTNDDVGIIKVFAEQIAIAVENDILVRRAEKLEIRDELTGLFNKRYIATRLREEVARAVVARRPCSFILLDMDDFKKYEKEKGAAQAEIALARVSDVIRDYAGPLAKAGRMNTDKFAVILPESNKKAAIAMARKIRDAISGLDLSPDSKDKLTASAGVSENPLDGASADEIAQKAEEALRIAKENGKNKVVSQVKQT